MPKPQSHSKDNFESPASSADDQMPVSQSAQREERIMEFWQKERIFERSLEQTEGMKEFVFYDGPPFATGLPHYGHLLAGTIKDAIPRYQTMRGRFVPRQWGWDCHGLPVENEIEKELGVNTRKEIEEYGIDRFNERAREAVLRYADEWRRIVPRLGRFVDMENDYRTMDSEYTESVWWAFKTLYEKDLIYKGFKSMHLCPRCETALSNFEVNQGYKEVTDISVTAKFELLEEAGTYLLAWTTTPWTLPGNVALAVGPELDYAVVEKPDEGSGSTVRFIVAQDKLKEVFGEEGYEVVKTVKGQQLVGQKYRPLFDYYAKDRELPGRENGWQVYSAEFVTTDEGTGVVHIAPAFGQDDFELGREYQLPFVQPVDLQGRFRPEVTDLAGQSVKSKDNPQAADVEIIKLLAQKDSLFSKAKIKHSYPHCWRCDTPLLNYATDSWFVQVTGLKDRLIEENKKISWVPEHVGANRFGKWLEEVKDWAISRSRYWGAPLPVWQCEDCGERKVVGSISEVAQPGRNTYWVMRHGEAENNTEDLLSADPQHPHHLTDTGEKQVKQAAKKFTAGPDLIVASDFVRTAETAKLAAEVWGLSKEDIVWDKRLREFDFGDFHLQPVSRYRSYYPDWHSGFRERLPNGENYADIKRRTGELLLELEQRYIGRRIVLITHHTPAWLLLATAAGLNERQAVEFRGPEKIFFGNAEIRDLEYQQLPRNKDLELDLHRPYIDRLEFQCQCGGVMKRIEEVFDCWFESGSMPFASKHYPFDKTRFDPDRQLNFPANFIAEGLDQTRGWFYSMLVLGVALFGEAPYRQVVVNGTMLSEDGNKLSKSKKNYPDPMVVTERYGADALRQALLNSPVVRGEDAIFAESNVEEVAKKVLGRLLNVLSFFELYASSGVEFSRDSEEVLDHWIKSRVAETAKVMTSSLDRYQLDKAAREIGELVDDLSVWYLRRCRDRIKAGGTDGQAALATLGWTLKQLSLLMAPFVPFIAEDLYQRVKKHSQDDNWRDSVHLDKWPSLSAPDQTALDNMTKVRQLISEALKIRSAAGIKVRQPLSRLLIKESVPADHEEIIKEEVNVKEIRVDSTQTSSVELNIELTPELKLEGDIRELVRAVQSSRKKLDLLPTQPVKLYFKATTGDLEDFIKQAQPELKRVAKVEQVEPLIDQGVERVELSESQMEFSLEVIG